MEQKRVKDENQQQSQNSLQPLKVLNNIHDRLKQRLINHYVQITCGKIIYLLYYLIDPNIVNQEPKIVNTYKKTNSPRKVQKENQNETYLESELKECIFLIKKFVQDASLKNQPIIDSIKKRISVFFSPNKVLDFLRDLQHQIKQQFKRIKPILIAKGEKERRQFHQSGLIKELSSILNHECLIS